MGKRKWLGLVLLFGASSLLYLLVAFLVRRNGFYHYEALFFTEKILVLSDRVHPKFNLIGFSYPTLQFVICAFFFWLKPIWIPLLTSASGVSFLLCLFLHYQVKMSFPWYLKLGTVLFFWLNPVLLFAACSGSSAYLSLVLIFVFIHSLFQYLDDLTTYRIAAAALCMPLVLFANYKLMWLIVFLLPFIVLVSLHSLGLKNMSLYQQIETALNNRSLRRKFVGKSYSILIILLFLPTCSVFFFLLINQLYTNNPFFFLENPNSTWNSLDVLRFFEFGAERVLNFFSIDTLFVLWRSLLFCPMFFIALVFLSGNFYRFLLAASILTLLLFLHHTYGYFTITTEYLLLYISSALPAMLYYVREARNKKAAAAVMLLSMGLSVFSAYYYLASSSYLVEKKFSEALQQKITMPDVEESRKVANYVREHIPEKTKILIDDAVLYPVVAFSGRTDFLILHYHPDFLAVLQNAEKMVDYIILPDESKDLGSLDIINQYHRGMFTHGRDYLKLVFRTTGYRVYKVLKPGMPSQFDRLPEEEESLVNEPETTDQ